MFDSIYSRELSSIEWKIYNNGERLIPKVTHDIGELIRHESSYFFFKEIIELDLMKRKILDTIKIIDLGCGVGYGCCILAELLNVQITGVDISQESLEYAKTHYIRSNITYKKVNLIDYIPLMPEFDYVIVSHVLEHLPAGLSLPTLIKWHNRLLFNIPYNESSKINDHHLISNLNEKDFTYAEIFFQDLSGIIYDINTKPDKPLSMFCIYSQNNSIDIKNSNIHFPKPAWKFGELLERLKLEIKRKKKLIKKINGEILKIGESKTKEDSLKIFYMKETISNEELKIENFKKQIEEVELALTK